MRHKLDEVELLALLWLGSQIGPIHSVREQDPKIATIRQLIVKRLAKVAKVIPLPGNEHLKVSCFALTKKGKRYYAQLSSSTTERKL